MESIPASSPSPAKTASPEGVLLVGNPNVGKSALFGALTGNYVTVSNYPGTTVEIARGTATLDGARVAVIDTPGTNSLLPSTDDERVTRDMLLTDRHGSVVVVADAKNLRRAAFMAVQLAELEVPFVLCLNMMDEAEARGARIDAGALARRIGVEIVPTVAVTGRGLGALRAALRSPRVGRGSPAYPDDVERAIARVAPRLPAAPVAARALAVMTLCGDASLLDRIRGQIDGAAMAEIDAARAELAEGRREPISYVVNRVRLAEADRIAEEATPAIAGPARRRHPALTTLEAWTTHPWLGLPILAAVLWVAYQFVGVFGAGTLVDLMENGLFGHYLNPMATALVDRVVPFAFFRDLLVGEYGVITMALTYSLALVFPIVGTFFLAFGALEDSGYLPRLAVMVNRLFKKIGLNGKAVLPMVLGLGCDTMATLTTRILETKKERLIVILLLALGVPCSAQLTVILAMLGAMSGLAVVIWLGVVLGVLFVVGRTAAAILPGRGSDFVLELPPLRVPRLKNIAVKTVARIEWYLKEAVPLFVLGTLILFLADRLNLLAGLENAVEPVLTGLLGLPKQTAEAFVIGFLRRDFGAAGLYHMAQAGTLDAVQVLVAVVTITLFIPCIANFFMIVKERGWRTGLAIAAFIFPFALGVGAALNFALRGLGVPL